MKSSSKKPKTRATAVIHKEASAIIKRKYHRQKEERQPKKKDPVTYATDQVEQTGKQTATFAARQMKHAVIRHHRNKKHTQTSQNRKQTQKKHTPKPNLKHPVNHAPPSKYQPQTIVEVEPNTASPPLQKFLSGISYSTSHLPPLTHPGEVMRGKIPPSYHPSKPACVPRHFSQPKTELRRKSTALSPSSTHLSTRNCVERKNIIQDKGNNPFSFQPSIKRQFAQKYQRIFAPIQNIPHNSPVSPPRQSNPLKHTTGTPTEVHPHPKKPEPAAPPPQRKETLISQHRVESQVEQKSIENIPPHFLSTQKPSAYDSIPSSTHNCPISPSHNKPQPHHEKQSAISRSNPVSHRFSVTPAPQPPSSLQQPKKGLRERGKGFSPKTRPDHFCIKTQKNVNYPHIVANTIPKQKEILIKRHLISQRNKLRQAVSKSGAKQAGTLLLRGSKAVGRAVLSLMNSLIAACGGMTLVVILLCIVLLCGIAASPFGILFSGQSHTEGTMPIASAIAQIQYDFNQTLEAIQTEEPYSSITVEGEPADWVELLAVFAVKEIGTTDVLSIDAEKLERLNLIFWDMTAISSEVLGDTLTVTITHKTASDMAEEYSFTQEQLELMESLLAQREQLEELIGNLVQVQADAYQVLRHLPETLSPQREAVIRTACSLVGKVNYFWGGKSLVLGWDSRWGNLMQVTAAGNSSSGTYRPYGLDCSGYVDWVFYNVSGGEYVIGHGGGVRVQHTYCTPITWSQAQIGDLVFYPDDSHIGIVAGWDEGGNILIVHCNAGGNHVTITGKSGFTHIGRPYYYGEP